MAAKPIAVVTLALLASTAHAFPSVLSVVTDILSVYKRSPKPPQYADSYEVFYKFTLPYEREYLPDGLTFPVRVWRDGATKRIRMDTYDGVNSLITNEQYNLEIYPKVNKTSCAKFKNDPGEPGLLNTPILPDVNGWDYLGKDTVNDRAVHVWEYSKRHGEKHTMYKFYATKEGEPVRLYMHGNDAFSGAHFDVYIADYSGYKPGSQDGSVFDPPASCKGVVPEPSTGPRGFPARMRALAPVVRYGGNPRYDSFLGRHGRVLGSQAEYDARVDNFLSNAALIEAHNADPSQSSKLELNRFADWSQEEFEAVMLPRHSQKRGMVARNSDKSKTAELPYKRLVPKERLPTTVDWRGSLADLVVKDQAACGSCWAFATTGVLEAAHYLATGEPKLFSEQQSMDCSWGYGLNKACDGGDYDAAMDYLKLAGGVATEAKYEYLGADNFCKDDKLSENDLTPFEGYAYVPPGDDEALMEAVYSRGPIAVSLDASQPSFRFYSGGVMDEPNCMWKSDDLDHAVMLVGYGKCAMTGKDYWLIRNSWSTHWGDDGYVKIARAHHGCGISTDPVYAVFKSADGSASG